MKLTKAQNYVLAHITDEPQTAGQIAEAAGLLRKSVTGHLYALNAKGAVRKELGTPPRYSLP